MFISPAHADSIYVNGTGVRLEIESPNGEWMTYPSDLDYPTYDVFDFDEDDGINYTVTVNTGYTISQMYLYHGDGTGQFVSANTEYGHTTGLHANLKPALVVIYSNNSVEELLAPELWEGGFASAALPPGASRPVAFVPPTTNDQAIDSALSNNGHTLIAAPVDPYVGQVLQTGGDGTKIVWLEFGGGYHELYYIYTDGAAAPVQFNGKPICYCKGEACRERQTKPKTGTKCGAHVKENSNPSVMECNDDDPECL